MPRSAPATTLVVDGLPVELTRRRVKSARLAVRGDGSVRLSAAPGVPQRALEAFVRQQRDWILRQQERQRRREAPVEDLHDGGRALVWGRWCEVRFTHATRASARLGEGVVHLAAPDADAAARAMAALRRRLVESRVVEESPVLASAIGRSPAGFRYRAMTSRWGSCNVRTGWITINTWLAQRRPEALTCVLAHEIAHLVEAGHGPRFRAILDDVVPGWQTIRRELDAQLLPRKEGGGRAHA